MKSNRLLIAFILLFILLTASFFAYRIREKSLHRDLKEIRSEGILRVVTEYNQSGYFVSGDSIRGFHYELCEAISELSGIKVDISLDMSLSSSFKGLEKRRYDIIAGNIPVTSDVRQDYLFTDPIVLNRQVLVQRKSDTVPLVRNQLDIAQKTLYVTENSPALLRLANLQHEIGDTIYIVEEARYSSEQLIIMVAKGEIDYAVCDRHIAEISKEQFPEIDVSTDISFTQFQSWALRKESQELCDSLNHWLEILKSNGVFNRIYREYYGK